MKEIYFDIMEKSLSAYTPERIRDYIDAVRGDRLKEHGFPRMGSNIGILMAYGRRMDLLPVFIEIMDLCCAQMPTKRAANDFSVREVCCCLMLMEEKGLVSQELLHKWKSQLATFEPWTCYSRPNDNSGKPAGNWTMFAAVSEYMRGAFCGIDTSEFVDLQIPSQLANLDENDMYQDNPPYNDSVYDLMPRALFAFLLRAGYKGKYAQRLEQVLDNTAEITLQMQSVTGELSFGGRSNQFLHNEAMLCAYCEMEAARYWEKGDVARAGQFKAAAQLAAKAMLRELSREPISHVKNRYPVDSSIGCEDYAYFNKYMITVASNVYMGLRFMEDAIPATVAPAEAGGYVTKTGDRFHKVFLNAGGYGLELDTDADPHYDAGGLGRVHKRGCPSALCLSVPFAQKPSYGIPGGENPTTMSLCCYAIDGNKTLLGASQDAKHTLQSSQSDAETATAIFDVKLSQDITVTQTYTVSKAGVEIALSGYEDAGFCLPVFEFDGAEETRIDLGEKEICVTYQNARCCYRFAGALDPEYQLYYNRNGRYRVYHAASKQLRITMENDYET